MEAVEVNVQPKRTFYSIVVKRALDIVLSLAAIIVLSWLLLVVCILELIFHGWPVFYTTKRPGKDEKIFKLIKFRSMTNARDENGYLLPEEQRLTKFGLFIRKTSIDELPELFNILKGDMSIIGPRPLLVEYLDLYSPRHKMRHSVRPGFACVRIKNDTGSATWTWREQFENDIYYIENVSLTTDVKMVLAVIREVFKASDGRAQDTRVPFDGKNLDEVRSKNEVENVVRYESVAK